MKQNFKCQIKIPKLSLVKGTSLVRKKKINRIIMISLINISMNKIASILKLQKKKILYSNKMTLKFFQIMRKTKRIINKIKIFLIISATIVIMNNPLNKIKLRIIVKIYKRSKLILKAISNKTKQTMLS